MLLHQQFIAKRQGYCPCGLEIRDGEALEEKKCTTQPCLGRLEMVQLWNRDHSVTAPTPPTPVAEGAPNDSLKHRPLFLAEALLLPHGGLVEFTTSPLGAGSWGWGWGCSERFRNGKANRWMSACLADRPIPPTSFLG